MGFSQALSGLNAASSSLDVLGNNIANSQTVGYKSSGAQFADVYAGSTGLGTKVSQVLQDFSDGNIESTGRNLDLAISGSGFYRFQQEGEVVYSRNGQLTMTADGYLENAQGARIMGYGINNAGEVQVGGQPTVLNVSSEALAANATTNVITQLNLDARKVASEGLSQTQVKTSMQDAGNSVNQETLNYHYSNNFTVYDSLGEEHSVSIYYEKRPEAENSWLAKVVMDGYYDMTSDPVGQATSKVSGAAEDAQDVAKSTSDDLLSSMQDVQSNLSSLKTAMQNAASTAAAETGADGDSVRQAVNDAAGQFASSEGFSLTEVLDKYLNGEEIEPAQNAALGAYIQKVQDDMEGLAGASDVKDAVDAIDPMNEPAIDFQAFVDAKSASLVEGTSPEYAGVASAVTNYIKDEITDYSNIAGAVSDAQGTDFDTEASVVTAVQDVVSSTTTDVLAGVTNPDIINAVNNVESADDGATTVTAVVDTVSAADPGEAFEAFGNNDFIVEFNPDGTLDRVGQPELTDSGAVQYADVANNVPSMFFASNGETPLGGAAEDLSFTLGLDGSTQFGASSQVGQLSQDGYTSGALVGISIEDDGTVMRNYSNEQSVAAGQIALANFRNPEGLEAVGDNAWRATASSGQELVGEAGTGMLGTITSGAIETSNVDLAKQLVDMIVTQRAYQANSQTISTQDEVLQAAINLSR